MLKEQRKHYWEYGEQSKEDRKKFYIGDILENAARCKICGDYIRSNNKHDFKTCSCGNISVDGGSWHASRCFKVPDMHEDIIVCYKDAT